MANAAFTKPPKPIELDKFLGVNESVGQTEIKLGEAVQQENFRITKNYKLQKRFGFEDFVVSANPMRGFWHGTLGGIDSLVFATGGQLYKRNLSIATSETALANLLSGVWPDNTIWNDPDIWDEGANPPVISIGPITDTSTIFFYFESKLYIKAGSTYKTYDGTTYADVEPYTPTISVGGAPDGTGAALAEEINLLSGAKTIQRVGNGTANYTLPEQNIDATAVTATVNGVVKVEGVDFTVNRVTGVLTFNTPPVNGAIVTITYTKVAAGNRDLVMNHKYVVLFGVESDTNVFLFGGTHEKNIFRYSMVAKPNYFPAGAFVKVGTNEFAITALKPQYQSLLVFKERDTKIVKPTPNPLYTSNKGLNPYNFPYFDLNDSVGNIAPNMVQLVENNPVSLYGSSMWLWSSDTGVEDERNARIMSDRYKLSLQDEDLEAATTYDFQDEKEHWTAVDGKVYIWNYGNDTMYQYTNITATEFLTIGGMPYFISGNSIRRFDRSLRGDNGQPIPCKMYTGFSDFGQPQYRKMMRQQWVSIDPAARTSVTISFITDRVDEVAAKDFGIEYRYLDFNDIDFNDFSFLTNVNPQPNRLKAKVKKFTYLQVLFENNTNNETLTVLELMMQAQTQGFSR